MVEFITLGHSVFDTTSHRVVDYIYHIMHEGPVVWVDNTTDSELLATWCSTLYPQRLLLHKHLDARETLKKGIIYSAGVEHLNTLETSFTACSRGIFIPQTSTLLRTIHFVDDNREHNRESYRAYQKLGIKPTNTNLDTGKL